MKEFVMQEMDENPSERSMPAPAWQQPSQEEAFERSMKQGSFMDQYRALIYRNLTIKKRDKRKTLTVSFFQYDFMED